MPSDGRQKKDPGVLAGVHFTIAEGQLSAVGLFLLALGLFAGLLIDDLH